MQRKKYTKLLSAKFEHTQVAVQRTVRSHRAGQHSGRSPRGTGDCVCWAGTGNGSHWLCPNTSRRSCTGLSCTRWSPLHISILSEIHRGGFMALKRTIQSFLFPTLLCWLREGRRLNQPVYPGLHRHLYSLIPSWHSPFWQGLLAQSSSLISQFTPSTH